MSASDRAARSPLRRLRRFGPEITLSLILVLAVFSIWQTWSLANHVRREARSNSQLYAKVIAAMANPEDAGLLLQITGQIDSTGVPVIVTDLSGRPILASNLPFLKPGEIPDYDDKRVVDYVAVLDSRNEPVSDASFGQVHFGSIPVGQRLTRLAVVQLGLLFATVVVGLWAYRAAVDRNRDRLWVAVARESAHQLGTPLMSAGAWVERLADGDDRSKQIGKHLTADIERMQRVAQRFERIGRPARAERVALGAMAERVANYFEPRLPQHANKIKLDVSAPNAGPIVEGDPVLVEWAVEALVRNAIDALSGRGGNINVSVGAEGNRASVTVADDGPGISPDVRDTLFDPGVTTKQGGWGIGLALARRIVEDVHGGTIELRPSPLGAVFRVTLPLQSA